MNRECKIRVKSLVPLWCLSFRHVQSGEEFWEVTKIGVKIFFDFQECYQMFVVFSTEGIIE